MTRAHAVICQRFPSFATTTGVLLGIASAAAQPVPDYGFDWATIGNPGNRLPNEQEAPALYEPGRTIPGAVDYQYRISRTEVTVGQWFEFVQAYAPHYDGFRNDQGFTSLWIWTDADDARDPSGYRVIDGAANRAANMSWYMAARYTNWLHNGKAGNAAAFESGVYDTSSFGSGQEVVERSPDARFWIPSLDEWTKAAHYDPNRYGPGQEGYWQFPHSSDAPPIAGMPWEGGESAADVFIGPGQAFPWLDVGSYSDVQSPWGLLDLSGGRREWLEDQVVPDVNGGIWRRADGSSDFSSLSSDHLDRFGSSMAPGHSGGLRIAGAIPSPSTIGTLALALTTFTRRRR